MVDFGKKLDNSAVKSIIGYLFGPKQSKLLDTSCDIPNAKFFQTLTYYRILDEAYDCPAANKVADILERLSTSNKRMGRLEAVNTLTQELPKGETILRGIADNLEKTGSEQ